ncbi:MAG: sulfatase [Planctomycetota bacterium]|nr:sulfatase [Planctomycetota bacterium]
MSNQQRSVILLRKAALAMMAFEWIQVAMGSAPIPGVLVLACVIVLPFPFYAALLWPIKRFVRYAKIRKVVFWCLAFRAFMPIIGNVFANELLRIAPQVAVGVIAIILVVKFTPDKFAAKFGLAQKWLSIPAVVLFYIAGFVPLSIHETAVSSEEYSDDSPNIVLLSWDTVRADVLSLYGGTGLDTPNLDKFASRSVVFNDAVAHTPITGPEHSLMLSGLLPPSNGLRANVLSKMPDSVTTLPEMLSDKGYATGGFVSSYPMLGRFGFQQGFSIYNDIISNQPMLRFKQLSPREIFWAGLLYPFLKGSPKSFTSGPVVQGRAIEWLSQQNREQPYFMFLHLYDAHGPYEPSPEFEKIALERINSATPAAFDGNDSESMARYRAEIAMLDSFFGEFLIELEKRDPGLENTLIILTSDHGECFGEGGIHFNHVPSLFEATQHIPLVVHFPKDAGAGTRINETVTHLDIFPTCLFAAGGDLESLPQDVATYPLQLAYSEKGMGYSMRDVYLEAQQTTLGDDRLRGWRTAERKYLISHSGEEQLFNYRANEVENQLLTQSQLAIEMRDTLLNFFNALPIIDGAVLSISVEDERAMGDLGYTD